MKNQTPAQAIKSELKKAFPKVKFSCTYDCYAGGDSVHISWTDGPTKSQVERIANKYQYGNFDAFCDYYDQNNMRNDIPQAKRILTHRTITQDKEAFVFTRIKDHCSFRGNENDKEYQINSRVYTIFEKNPLIEDKEIIGIDLKQNLLLFTP